MSNGAKQSRSGGLNWKTDILASVVVFLVALPLCMGIAIASGAPIAAGLITGIVGGIIVGMIAGAPLQVSGPAAGLTVIVYDIVQQYGLPALGPVVLIAGGLQVVCGVARLGQWFRAVSPAVIKGMLSGIGVLIFASQFHVMVDDNPRKTGLQNLLTIPEAIGKGLPLPELGTEESRSLRTHYLKRFGRVHELQVEVHEAVDETVSEYASSAKLPGQVDFTLVAQKQRVIHEELVVLMAGLVADSSTWNHGKSERIKAEAETVLAESTAALTILEEGRVSQVRASQRAVQTSLESLLGSLKNHDWAAKIGLLTIGIIVLWGAVVSRKIKLVPAPLIAIVIVAGMAAILQAPVLYVEVPGSLLDGVHFPTLTILDDMSLFELVKCGLVIAAVASAETLLCATAVDQMHNGPRTRYDQELAAQGVGNMLCGILGALPMTGVIVRSAANVQAGGTSKLSAILHGLWILLFVSFFGNVLTLITTAALAGILVYTGYKLINPSNIRELWQYGKSEVFIYVVTVVTIVVEDLLIGVITGIVLSAIRLLLRFSRLRSRLEIAGDRSRATLKLEGAATFLRLPLLAAKLDEVPQGAELHVDLSKLDYIDHGCLDLIVNWSKQHESNGGTLVIDWDLLQARFGKRVDLTASSGH